MRVLSSFILLAVFACAQTLPVNWRVQPAGMQVALDSLPLSAAVSPDGKFLLALNAGSHPSISVIETGAMKETSRVAIADAGLGLAFSPDGRRVYAGGGSRNVVFEFSFSPAGELKISREISAGQPAAMNFIGDVAVAPDGRTILAGDLFHDRVLVINAQSGQVTGALKSGRRPYRILFHPDGQSYFVSSWADASVYEYSLPSGNEMARARVGAHPTDLVLSNRKISGEQNSWQYRLFVAAANTNDVFVVGVSEGKELNVIETLNTGFSAVAPAGMTPSSLALSADQTRLYIACSDVNAVAVADISETRSRVAGSIPVGAYPTAVRVVTGGRLAVLNGHSSSLSVIDAPTDEMLPEYTTKATAATPYRESFSDSLPEQRSSIEHVIYILMAGASSGPNATKLAREFVRLENFRPAGDTPASALHWAIAAIAPDFTERLSPSFAAGRLRYNGFEGGEPANLPAAGYLWSNALSAGLTVRNYGLFVDNAVQGGRVKDPSLLGVTNMKYRDADPQAFLDDLKQFESPAGMMPNLTVLRTTSDAALGRIVEAVSKSKFWPQTAIFVMNPSAPTPVLLALSPYTRRGAADATPYDQASVLRTIELILNLRPMTIFDFSARSLAAAFVSTPNNAAYSLEPSN
ncbi:MAG TPA: bifunctional YncE family protein/alkaline phosphatase family protein [Bryobacteraceae bacterium]|jgi:DNA-binding beta-propeller fold protein YncE|nr:bifunctional YncE family protein/alkaline phosphatase family protein [Bryobacteraceae bacterium]